MQKKIAIIGAGAAGCFCAIEMKRQHPDADVTVFEASTKPLAKVAITGGGRCNLTNSFRCCLDEKGRLTNLQTIYPRGDKLMRKMLSRFSHEDTWRWFESEGVRLLTQEDECVFPVSQDAMEIVNTLTRLMRKEGVKLQLRSKISEILPNEDGTYTLMPEATHYDAVIITTGGSPRETGLAFLKSLDLEIIPPLPSLFTFNISGELPSKLMGTVVEDTCVSLAGTKHKAQGPLLWTHWGVSGPAILRLSSYAARDLANNNYQGTLTINWYAAKKENEVREEILKLQQQNSQKNITNVYPRHLTQKHWSSLLDACAIPSTQRWGALNPTHINRLVAILTSQQLSITGRSQWKEEFVTCGGVSLNNISPKTLECKTHPGLYFAGEVLDVDAVTGGFNLQAAWSMGYVAAHLGK